MDASFSLFSELWLGKPLWLWFSFLSIIGGLLWLDLGVVNKGAHEVPVKKALVMWGGFVGLALAFAGYVYYWYNQNHGAVVAQDATIKYLTGYLLETSLAFDNVFVISMIFTYFAVPPAYQHRVLFWGIIGAIVFRAIFIGVGAALVEQFTWVLFIFAGILLVSGVKMLKPGDGHGPDLNKNPLLNFLKKRLPITETIESDRFLVKKPDAAGKLVTYGTPLLLALVMVEAADIIFAIDSVPAIFAVTQDTFIVYTSNIFAILGLRSMYFVLANAVERFKYLKYGLATILILIAVKIVWNFGFVKWMHWPKIDPIVSLLATLAILFGAIAYSWFKTKGETATPHAA